MRIIVKSTSDQNIRLRLPTRLLLNRMTIAIAAKELKRRQIPISRAQLQALFHTLLDYKKRHPEWVLFDVLSADGDYVYFKL